jgi:hypothetical protein
MAFKHVPASHAQEGADRHSKGGIGMRKLFVATAMVALFTLLVSPALGASGGNGKG